MRICQTKTRPRRRVRGGRSRLVPLCLALLALAVPLEAQETQESRRALEVWGGLASNSPRWGLLGASPEMNLGVLAVRFSRLLGERPRQAGAMTVEYTFDLIPLVVLSPPFVSARGSGLDCPGADLCVLPQTHGSSATFPAGSAAGLGFNPAGLTLRFHPARVVTPTVGFAVGGLLFDRAVPTTRATRFNFTASAEVGLRLGPPERHGVTVTYRFHHISNAGTSSENPGVASHLITLGIHVPRPHRTS